MIKPLYQKIASLTEARLNCEKYGNNEWFLKHGEAIYDLVNNYMPSGSGIDNGTQFDFERSTPNKLVFGFGYHHMDEGGCYCGWTDHRAIVTPSLQFSFDLRITGRDKRLIKDYLYDTFDYSLRTEVS